MPYPATRLLTMLELLQTRHRRTGAELAERLEIDERTVRRYAARLVEMGIPVEADRGRYGGYRLLPGYKLPPLMFSDDEATAVVLGLLAARRLGLPSEATESTLAKILRVLPTALRGRVQALEQTLGFTLAARGSAAPDTAILLTLAAAAREQRRVRLGYRSWNGTESERDFDAYGLVFHSGRWYATGHDHQSGERRTFRVDRMTSAEPRPEPYEIPEDADPVGQVTRALSSVPYAHEVEVLLETGLTEAQGRIPPTVGTLTEAEGGVLLRTRVERFDGMAQMLAGLGWPFVIQHPEELREAVRAYADHLAVQGARRGSSSLM